MYYREWGKGKAIILLHGFIEEGSMWNDLAQVLSKKYRVIVPDLEGFGESKLESRKLSMTNYAQDIFLLLQKLKIKKCILLGHSMGGYITLHFAEKYSEMLTAFGLINSHCFADTAEKKLNRKKGNEFIQKHGTKVFVRELYRNLFHPAFKNEKLVAALSAKAETYSSEALVAANTAMMNRADKAQVLKTSKVPVLLINGKQDESAPAEFTLKQAAYPAIADVHFYENCKHMSLFEKKKESTSAILNFAERSYR